MSMTELFGDEPIFSYSRAEAIADGVLVDAKALIDPREAGIKFPVALTSAVWGRYVEFNPLCVGQDVNGRLWDILWMLRCAVKRSDGSDTLDFKLHVAMPDKGDWERNEDVPERGSGLTRTRHRLVTLKAVCGPGDNAEPVITIMLPNED